MATCRWACLCASKHIDTLTHTHTHTHTRALYPLLQHLSNPLLAAVQWRLCDCQYCGSAPGASSPHQRWLDYPDVCTPRHLTISQHLHMQPQHSTLLLIWGVCVCVCVCVCVSVCVWVCVFARFTVGLCLCASVHKASGRRWGERRRGMAALAR